MTQGCSREKNPEEYGGVGNLLKKRETFEKGKKRENIIQWPIHVLRQC